MTANDNDKALSIASTDNKDVAVQSNIFDVTWARDLENLSDGFFSNKASRFLSAVSSGNLWRVMNAVKLNESLFEGFITETTGLKALEKAASKNNNKIIGFLLESGFVKKYGLSNHFLELLVETENKEALTKLITGDDYSLEKDDDGYLLFKAAIYGKDELCDFFVQLGLDSSVALTITHAKGLGSSAEMIRQSVLKNNLKKEKSIKLITVDAEPKPKKIEAPIVESPVKESTEYQTWAAMTDDIVVKHENVPHSNIKLATIFNFKARNITTICSIDKSAPPSIHVQNFQDVEDDNVFREAWEKLKDLDKNPPEFKGNEQYMVQKPKLDQKMNIKGK